MSNVDKTKKITLHKKLHRPQVDIRFCLHLIGELPEYSLECKVLSSKNLYNWCLKKKVTIPFLKHFLPVKGQIQYFVASLHLQHSTNSLMRAHGMGMCTFLSHSRYGAATLPSLTSRVIVPGQYPLPSGPWWGWGRLSVQWCRWVVQSAEARISCLGTSGSLYHCNKIARV